MRPLAKLSAAALAAASLAPAAAADGRQPGSVLIYPIHRSGGAFFTVVSVTNRNTTPATPFSFGGTTKVMFQYVNTVANPADSQLPLDCVVVDRVAGAPFGVRGRVLRLTSPLRPGDAGGPVIDAKGRLVAVAFATDPTTGLAVAVPLDTLHALVAARALDRVPACGGD